jgi:hypothetical protein
MAAIFKHYLRTICVLGVVVYAIICLVPCKVAFAKIPPPPAHMDDLLNQAEVIVVGRVKPGSLVIEKSPDGHKSAHQLSLLVSRTIKSNLKDNVVTLTYTIEFPMREFPKTQDDPQDRLLLTGWNEWGHISEKKEGLDLYADQIWFLERLPEEFLVFPDKAPFGVQHLESVQSIEYSALVELFVRNAGPKEVRELIDKSYKGIIPEIAVEYFRDSAASGVGEFVWDYLKQEGASEQIAYRTLDSLAREEALKWCREGLSSQNVVIRRYALDGMMVHTDKDSVPSIIKLLGESKDYEEKEHAIRALGVIGDTKAVPALIELLKHKDPEDNEKPPGTFLWEHARKAIRLITNVCLSPNGDKAIRWWNRNKDKPRWHWLKQGIEQDLQLFDRSQEENYYVADMAPRSHLSFATCRQVPLSGWEQWWKENKHFPQEKWVLDSFKEAGYPLPDLCSKDAVQALIGMLNTKPGTSWNGKPVLDWLHHQWCHLLLKRLTGLSVSDSRYAFYIEGADWEILGPKWQTVWKKHSDSITLKPIEVSQRQDFQFEEEDRNLLLEDFNILGSQVVLKGPLVRKELPNLAGKQIIATFEITLSNKSKDVIIIHTRPSLRGCAGSSFGDAGSLTRQKFECVSHSSEFATLKPGESIKWIEEELPTYWGGDNKTWVQFRLLFQRSGKDGKGWRGEVRTEWVSVRKEDAIEK